MSRFDEIWSGAATRSFEALSVAQRDRAEALVREICRDPYGAGGPVRVDGPARDRLVVDGDITVHYQVDDIGELVYIVGVDTR